MVTYLWLSTSRCCEHILPIGVKNSKCLGWQTHFSGWLSKPDSVSQSVRWIKGVESQMTGSRVAQINLQKACHKLKVNWGPWSETTSWWRPNTLDIWSHISLAVSEAEGNLSRGKKRQALDNLSMTPRMTALPWKVGKPVKKSGDVCDHGLWGMGKGWST